MNGLGRVAGLIVLIALMVGDVRWSNVLAQQAGDRKSEEAEKNEAARAEPNEEKSKGEVVEIPLDQIWAYKMPGARDIQELDQENIRTTGKALLDTISESVLMLRVKHRQEREASPGFAVLGSGLEVLRNVNAVLVEGSRRRESFPAGSDITLAFFSHQFSAYVHLQKVERRENVIEVQYRYIRALDMISSVQLALIPLGHLPVGKYQVELKELTPVNESPRGGYEQLPPHLLSKWKEKKRSDQFVSGPFSFRVVDDAEH